MTQLWCWSDAARAIQAQGSYVQFQHSIPNLKAECICSHNIKQSSLKCAGWSLNSSWVGCKDRRGGRRLAVATKHRSVKAPVCAVPSIGQDQFEESVLKSDVPVLVDFWAEWCGPCKLVAPVVDWAAKNYVGQLKVYKIDTDASPELVSKYKLYGLPTLILFKAGEEVPGSRKEGAITAAKLQAHLDDLLPTLAAT
ncbi:hypothetical protein O6H91_10G056000 [Diphasiastrum complanatum]|uniref:Uncharacterized protein n=1 Tax=Diphasiastrum complanatum TaxID=34168 RepID=A0ACC2CHI0_DIPCM|nr:hypothetical protein O6H91_Y424500 [Diphasiastrum complanatum]KAJ7541358.1 hypothetical protein O6H91_10G056000 [Diphasiastrum complanatum]